MDKNEANKKTVSEEIKANSISELIILLSSVDIESPEAELNENTIRDNNGGRILL